MTTLNIDGLISGLDVSFAKDPAQTFRWVEPDREKYMTKYEPTLTVTNK